jgi:hypothetical protein
MDVHDGLGDGGERGLGEPPGLAEEDGSGAADDGATGPADPSGDDGAGGYDAGPAAGSSSAGSSSAGSSSAGSSGAGSSGAGSSGAGSSGAGSSGADGSPDGGSMIVEVDGEARQLPAERDFTGDGRPDAAAETPDGRVIVFADTEDNETGAAGPDGRADEAYVVDKRTGKVVGAAHIDPASGQWVEEMDPDGAGRADSRSIHQDGGGVVPAGADAEPVPAPAAAVDPETGPVVQAPAADPEPGPETGEWADGPAPGRGGSTDPGEPGGTPGGGSGTMTVDLGGETRELPAERDYTGDGRPDAAAETADGKVIVFADTEDNETGAADPDGRADEAYVVDKQTGRVLGAAHVDPRTGEWVEGVDTAGSPAAPAGPPAGVGGEVDS